MMEEARGIGIIPSDGGISTSHGHGGIAQLQ